MLSVDASGLRTPLITRERPTVITAVATIATFGVACGAYVAYGGAVLVRVGAVDGSAPLAFGVIALALLWYAAYERPFAVAIGVLGIVPLFGNHPGGRYMEAINLPLAASAAGLIAAAHREQRAAPGGPIWRAAWLYLLTAIVAVIPVLPRIAVRAFTINSPLLFVTEALTAAEDDVLYAISSATLVTLAIVWAYALTWAGATERFAVRACRLLAAVMFAMTAIGLADDVGASAIGRWYVKLIDARAYHFVGLQAIFWHPGWFGWYFVVGFGLALGLWTIESGAARRALGVAIVAGYLAFLLNPERGGLVAVHVMLMLFAWDRIRRANEPKHVARRLAAIAIPMLALVALAVGTSAGRSTIARATLLSLERTVNNAEQFLAGDAADTFRASERLKLWSAAVRMWRSAPVFGIGEGSFAWRFHDYAAPGTPLDTPTYADAHSTWLQFLATRGIVGVAAYVALLLAIASALWREWREQRTARSTVTALVLAFAGFATYSCVYQLFYLQPIQLLFWLIVALTSARSIDRVRSSSRFAWGVAIAFAIAVVVQLAAVRPLVADVRARLSREPRGFYPVEVGVEGALKRWSSSAGVLCLDPSAARVQLRFEAVDPRIEKLPRTVTLTTAGRVVDRFQIATTSVVSRRIDLPGPYGPSSTVTSFGECTPASRRLSLAVDRTWSPADVGVNADPRHLGVLIFEPITLSATR